MPGTYGLQTVGGAGVFELQTPPTTISVLSGAVVGFAGTGSSIVEEGGDISISITGSATVMPGRSGAALVGFYGSAASVPVGTPVGSGALVGFLGFSTFTGGSGGGPPPAGTTTASQALAGFQAFSAAGSFGALRAAAALVGWWGYSSVDAAGSGVALPSGYVPVASAARARTLQADIYRVRVTVPPRELAVSLDEAKQHLRVQIAEDDALISRMIRAACGMAEMATRRALTEQSLELTMDIFPEMYGAPLAIMLPRPPAMAVDAVIYYDQDGSRQLVRSADLVLDSASEPAYLMPDIGLGWPKVQRRMNAVTVRYRAGYADRSMVPEPIRQWILLQLGAMYENRESIVAGTTMSAMPTAFVDGLLDPYITDWVVG